MVPMSAPDPAGARTLDEFIASVRLLKVWTGNPSITRITQRIHRAWRGAGRPAGELPARATVGDCFRLGRRRPNMDLLTAVVDALLCDDPAEASRWHQALRVVLGEMEAGASVAASDRLPETPDVLVGRGALLERAVGILTAVPDGVSVLAIEGMGGIGKTTLAVHLARRLLAAGGAAGGTLFVDLRGFDPSHPPADPAAVLESFLRLLGVPGGRIPRRLDALVAAYQRTLAASPRLVLLDNAADERQVRPLLPAHPCAPVLVTSRRPLRGLVGVERISVDVLARKDSLHLLRGVAGATRVDQDPESAHQIARSLGDLPLALAVVGNHMRDHPDWTPADYPHALTSLVMEGGVRSALALSDRSLPASAQRLLRLLALHPGRDFDTAAAAAVAGVPADELRSAVETLVAAKLLESRPAGRYGFHDLVRAYAAERARVEQPASRVRQALERLVDHYRHQARAAVDAVYPHERDGGLRAESRPTGAPVELDPADARAWLRTEHANLIAVSVHAAANGWHTQASDLAIVLFRYLFEHAHYSDAYLLNRQVVNAPRDGTDLARQATALRNLGTIHWQWGQHEQAGDSYQQALALFRRAGDRANEGRTLTNLGVVQGWAAPERYDDAVHHLLQATAIAQEVGDRTAEARAVGNLGVLCLRAGHHDDALGHLTRALVIAQQTGDRAGEGRTLGNLGAVYARTRRYQEAEEHLRRALAMARRTGERDTECFVLNDLGDCARHTGQLPRALRLHRSALAIARATGDPAKQARAHDGIGHVHLVLGHPTTAADHWQRALDLYRSAGSAEADQLRRQLADLERQSREDPPRQPVE